MVLRHSNRRVPAWLWLYAEGDPAGGKLLRSPIFSIQTAELDGFGEEGPRNPTLKGATQGSIL